MSGVCGVGLRNPATSQPSQPPQPRHPSSPLSIRVVDRCCYSGCMHLRLSTSLGTDVIDRDTGDVLGACAGIFIHPDTGKIEGVFVRTSGGLLTEGATLFCASADIVHWGMDLQVRSSHSVAPLSENIRLERLWAEGRTIVLQRVVTEQGRVLGRCRDVQFDTARMRLEWLFLRRFLRAGLPVPTSEIIEVRADAVVVRDPLCGQTAASKSAPSEEASTFEGFPEIAEACSLHG